MGWVAVEVDTQAQHYPLDRSFFWDPLVQEELIHDQKLKYFSPKTQWLFRRFLGSTDRTRNDGREYPVVVAAPGLRTRSIGSRFVQWKIVRQPSRPELFPVCRASPQEALVSGEKLQGRSPGHPGTQKLEQRIKTGRGDNLKKCNQYKDKSLTRYLKTHCSGKIMECLVVDGKTGQKMIVKMITWCYGQTITKLLTRPSCWLALHKKTNIARIANAVTITLYSKVPCNCPCCCSQLSEM